MTCDMVMTCCRNEEDVIGPFVQYYLASGFDRVHVIDNGSTDGTVNAVKSLAVSGLSVEFTIDPRDGYERHLTEWFQEIGRSWTPRWLFFLDCDEFILFPGSAKTYLDSLAPEVNRLRLRQKEIYPAVVPDPRPGGFLMSPRAEPQFDTTTKDVVRWHEDAVVLAGKHRVDLPDPITHQADDIFIRHYKYRTFDQARRKEENRVAVHGGYTDDDLARITAFDVDVSKRWVEYCKESLKVERWRTSFADDLPMVVDPEMAAYAAVLLPTVMGAGDSVKSS